MNEPLEIAEQPLEPPASGLEAGESPMELNNARYLSAAVEWLLLRMKWIAGQPGGRHSVLLADDSMGNHQRGGFSIFRRPPPQVPRVWKMQVDQAEKAMKEAEMADPPAMLVDLSRALKLTEFEKHLMLLCAAAELNSQVAPLCAAVVGDPNRPYPSFAAALKLFNGANWAALAPERPLQALRLVEIHQPQGLALTASPLRLDERVLSLITGLNYLDDRLTPLLSPLNWGGIPATVPTSLNAAVEESLQALRMALPNLLPVVQLIGSDPPSKRLAAWLAGHALGKEPLRLPAAALPAAPGEAESLLQLWRRESMLLPIALYIDAYDLDGAASGDPAGDPAARLGRFLEQCPGLVFLDTREPWPGLNRPTVVVDVRRPNHLEQQEAWSQALGSEAGGLPALLAGQFDLDLASIYSAARQAAAEEDISSAGRPPAIEALNPEPAERHCYQALAEEKARRLNFSAGGEQAGLHRRVWKACLDITRPRLEALAQRLEPKASWADIVLPRPEEDLLCEIAAQVGARSRVYDEWGFRQRMSRGLGISALFAGESGTGKTMAAEVIANELELHLYRIDLSAVVSKYIGETEKNLRRLFDAAENGGAILFFDEADALFGRRSEVKDSHDRYANIEINYLLQRMEAYGGLAILATNMKSALDPAFMRRLRFIVNFPFPGPQERQEIWKRAFPPGVAAGPGERGALDYARLARFNLTGGNIHNVAVNAAFLAARRLEKQPKVTMALALQAVRTELRKLNRPINEADFVLEDDFVEPEPPIEPPKVKRYWRAYRPRRERMGS